MLDGIEERSSSFFDEMEEQKLIDDSMGQHLLQQRH